MKTIHFIKQNWERYGLHISAIFIASLVLQAHYTEVPGISGDSSCVRAINMAIHNHLVFGKDFIFTFGPLGFLDTRNAAYLNKIVFIVFDLFLFWGYYRVLKIYIKENRQIILFLLLSMIFLRFLDGSYCTKLFLIYLFFIINSYKNNYNSYWDIVYISIACVILFFDKINYGLIAIPLLILSLLICLFKNSKGALLFILIPAFAFYISTCFFKTDVFHYIKYGIIIINNYNDSMYDYGLFSMGIYNKYFFLAFINILCLAILLLYSLYYEGLKQGIKKNWLAYALIALFCFLIFKNGFVRADMHMICFFYSFPLFICLATQELKLYNILYFKTQVKTGLLIGLIVFFNFQINVFLPHKFLVKIIFPYAYSWLGNNSDAIQDHTKIYFPATIVKEIKNSSVDIFPDEISLLELNHTNYKPRPMTQSYAPYSKEIDSLNASFLYSAYRPDYLIITNSSIDNRYPFWDEALSKETMHLNYHYIRAFKFQNDVSLKDERTDTTIIPTDSINTGTYLLLKANNKQLKKPAFEKCDSFDMALGDTKELKLPDSIPVFITACMSYSLKGKMIRTFFQPPPLNIKFNYDDGTSDIFKCLYPLLRTPLLINKRVLSNIELLNFLNGELKKNKNIISFQFIKVSGWNNKITVSLYKMSNY